MVRFESCYPKGTTLKSASEKHSKYRQIGLLVVTNAFVGAMVGLERTILPLIAEADFGISSAVAATAFIATFGLTKAVLNVFAGTLADRWGRKRLLVTGWIFALPVPLILMYAPSWSWVLFANVLLGINQALTWSMTVVMKVDLVSPREYGRVIGWNEFAGYAGMSVTAIATGVMAASFGLRPEPFMIGLAVALAGIVLSSLTSDTTPDMLLESAVRSGSQSSFGQLLKQGTFSHPALSSASASGLATNLKDGALWGLLPVLLTRQNFPLEQIGLIAGLYPVVWAVSQLYFGPLSDRIGRQTLIIAGLMVQGLGVYIFLVDSSFIFACIAATITGLGTGMVYPTLLAFVSEQATTSVRASALGVYRFWRDSGYAIGALGTGFIADMMGVPEALTLVTLLLLLSALLFFMRNRRQRVEYA